MYTNSLVRKNEWKIFNKFMNYVKELNISFNIILIVKNDINRLWEWLLRRAPRHVHKY